MLNKLKKEIKRYEDSLDRYWGKFDNDPRPILDYNNLPEGFKMYPNELLFGASSLLIEAQRKYILELEKRIQEACNAEEVTMEGFPISARDHQLDQLRILDSEIDHANNS